MPVLLIVGVCYEVLCPALFTYKKLLYSCMVRDVSLYLLAEE